MISINVKGGPRTLNGKLFPALTLTLTLTLT